LIFLGHCGDDAGTMSESKKEYLGTQLLSIDRQV
jgi:hypothetical protein